MAGFMTVKEAARIWDITERRVAGLCKSGRVSGAVKEGRSWRIPLGTQKPNDGRITTGAYCKHNTKLPLPVGISDYRLASSEYYYVDKTLMIKEILDERAQVSLFTRPRRFGKTLNMDMLRVFFEKSASDTSTYFTDKKIWGCGEPYRDYQGKYPVIYISFKDIKHNNWSSAYDSICHVLRNEIQRHIDLLGSDKISVYDKNYIEKVMEDAVSEADVSMILANLSRMLHMHYGEKTVIIIDEYDTPIQQGYISGYYDQATGFMRNFFSGGLKDNQHLAFGFLTGILRVAKESIFSGLNNIVVNSVLDNKYSAYFGFTSEEVMEMTQYYGIPEKFDEICRWYDGYRFGETDIFNPWSVINYFNNNFMPKAFWLSTSSNDIIGELIDSADTELCDNLVALLSGRTVLSYVDTSVIYPQIQHNPTVIYSFLLVTGYLKALKPVLPIENDIYELAIPNMEISSVYQKEILEKLQPIISPSTAIAVSQALYSGDGEQIQKVIRNVLLQSASNFDTVCENFYHGLMLGLCTMLSGSYTTSNRESGEGRYDLQLVPRYPKIPGILIEIKAGRDLTEEQLKKLSEVALRQIEDKKYDTEMLSKGIKTILKYGVAFSRKNVAVSDNKC